MPKMKKNAHPKSNAVPYARGFRRPSNKQMLTAASLPGEPLDCVPNPFVDKLEQFHGIPLCKSTDDWLAQYKEDGQTFHQFLGECPWLSRRRRKYMNTQFCSEGTNLPEKYPDGTVYIMPLEDVGERCNFQNTATFPHSDAIIEYSEIFLGMPVKKLPTVQLEAKNGHLTWIEERNMGQRGTRMQRTNMKSRYHHKSGRYQLCITDVLNKLRKRMPDDAICVIALTMYDLYEDETDLFVAGMAAGSHRVAVFSLLRYDPNLSFSSEFWYEIEQEENCEEAERQSLILQRSCKLVVHEISHLLGLDHCIFYLCCMNGSGHLDEDYRQPMYLCPVDLRKLQTLCGFSVTKRYQNLLAFYRKHRMVDEFLWVKKRLAYLNSSLIENTC